jgi:hypothetical protein
VLGRPLFLPTLASRGVRRGAVHSIVVTRRRRDPLGFIERVDKLCGVAEDRGAAPAVSIGHMLVTAINARREPAAIETIKTMEHAET